MGGGQRADGLADRRFYHAGWFIHPHNPKHRAYMTEDGCVYFHPTLRLYEQTVLKPKVASVCARSDWMREPAAGWTSIT